MNKAGNFDVVIHSSVFLHARLRGVDITKMADFKCFSWKTPYALMISRNQKDEHLVLERLFSICMKKSVAAIPIGEFSRFMPSLKQLHYSVPVSKCDYYTQIILVDYGHPIREGNLNRLPGIIVRDVLNRDSVLSAVFDRPVGLESLVGIVNELKGKLNGLVLSCHISSNRKSIELLLSKKVISDNQALSMVVPLLFGDPMEDAVPIRVEWA